MGKLRGNMFGSEYLIFDEGENIKRSKKEKKLAAAEGRGELGMVIFPKELIARGGAHTSSRFSCNMQYKPPPAPPARSLIALSFRVHGNGITGTYVACMYAARKMAILVPALDPKSGKPMCGKVKLLDEFKSTGQSTESLVALVNKSPGVRQCSTLPS